MGHFVAGIPLRAALPMVAERIPRRPAEGLCEAIKACERQIAVDKWGRRGQTFRQLAPLPLMPLSCKHPQVRVVAREEDVEFVECQACGEVFDAAEFKDILNEDEDEAEREEA